eukprot:scaffold163343_cov27-Tisochrysis_lutea.AAC.1
MTLCLLSSKTGAPSLPSTSSRERPFVLVARHWLSRPSEATACATYRFCPMNMAAPISTA